MFLALVASTKIPHAAEEENSRLGHCTAAYAADYDDLYTDSKYAATRGGAHFLSFNCKCALSGLNSVCWQICLANDVHC
jgi:hypothetical protein